MALPARTAASTAESASTAGLPSEYALNAGLLVLLLLTSMPPPEKDSTRRPVPLLLVARIARPAWL
jgi:hypothetical protein